MALELNQLFISEEGQALLATSIANYSRHAGLELSVDTLNGRAAWCTAWQARPAVDGRLLTLPELLDRAHEAFAPMSQAGWILVVCVYPYSADEDGPVHPKHRDAYDVFLDGRRARVLRQAKPRMLFAEGEEGLTLLATEDEVAPSFLRTKTRNAAAWLSKAAYRNAKGQ